MQLCDFDVNGTQMLVSKNRGITFFYSHTHTHTHRLLYTLDKREDLPCFLTHTTGGCHNYSLFHRMTRPLASEVARRDSS